MLLRSRLWFSLILLFVSSVALAQKSSSENDLKKKAEKSFNDQKYDEAVPLYSQLLSVYPQNPLYNYRYGVCLLYSGKDKSQAATYLEAAAKAPKPEPEVYYYLGRTYMYGNHFYEAIEKFDRFKKEGSPSSQKSFNVDMLIANCKNAIELNKDRRNVSIISHSEESRSNFYSSYDLSNASGKLLAATDNFLTPKDKDKKNTPVMFMNKENTTVFYSSYGAKGENGKDLYKAVNLGNGQWSAPVNLGIGINSKEDEDYPYLDKDGKTLYFCSKGHNSMGGYDIFKSVLDAGTGEWSAAVNIGVPINTVEDDILYVPSHAGDEATYATAIEAQTGTIDVRRVRLGDVIADVSVIKGIFVSQDQVMRKEARITVLRESSHDIVTSINTNPRTGEYELMLPPGEDYILVVEGGGYVPHAENFRLPEATAGVLLKQKVVMDRNEDKEQMTLNNFFQAPTGSATADNNKPSEVKVSEVNTRDIDTTKIKPITIDGKSVYVALPTVLQKPDDKSVIANQTPSKSSGTESETPAVNGVSANDPKDAEVKGEVASGASKDVKANETQNNAAAPSGTSNDVAGVKTDGGGTKAAGAVIAAPVATEKVSNSEVVKMSFDDAYALKEEAATMKVQAIQKQATADSLSTLSKEQKAQADQLMSTDSVAASQLADQSKANSVSAGNKKTEAFAMNKLASNKQKEADRAFSEATQLMTQLKVDTNSTAYQSASKSKPADEETTASANDKTNQSTLKEGGEPTGDNTGSQPIAISGTTAQQADNTGVHPEENETANAAPLNPHLENANRLEAESEALSSKSYEKSQAALNATDKNEKEQLENEAKDLKKQSEAKKDESAKEVLLAEKEEKQAAANPSTVAQNTDASANTPETTTPEGNNTGVVAAAAVNPRYEKANELKLESVELATQSDEKKQLGYSTTDKTEQATLLAESKDLKKQSEEKRKESEKEFALAQKEDKTQAKTADKNAPVADNNKPAEQSKTGDAANSTNTDPGGAAVVAAGVLAVNDKKDSPTVEGTTSGNETGTTGEKAANETAKENALAPEAAKHYEAYYEKNQQSEVSKKQAAAAETKILILPNGKEKDSLVEVANELNRQSIIQWQEGQKELEQAKAVDPEVEEKMLVASRGTEDGGRKPENSASNPEAGKQTADNTNPDTGNPKVEAEGSNTEAGKQTAENSKTEDGSPKLVAGTAIVAGATQTADNSKQADDNSKTESKGSNEKATDPSTQPTTQNSQPATGTEAQTTTLELDTTRAEYPQYVEVQKQIAVKQDETVNTFIEGMQVNKKAIAVKEEEMQLRDRAEVEKDAKKRETLVAQADSVKVIGDSLMQLSETKLTEAQEYTRTVKTLTVQSDELKSKLIVDKSAARVADASGKEQGQGNEVANNTGGKTEDVSANQGSTPATGNQNSGQGTSQVNESSPDDAASSAKTGSPASTEGIAIIPANYTPTDVSTFTMSNSKTTNEITMDPALPEGLVFKVQIGAFKTPLTADAFNGLQPLNGETSRPGWIRYCLGLFRSFEPASLLKKQVRAMGYNDAFVVAYFNGKRISLSEAYAMVGKATTEEKKAYASVSEMEFKHLSKYKMLQSDFDGKADEDSKAFYGTTETVSSDLIEYTVQVGAYKTPRTPSALTSLLPLNAEKTTTGLYRFTTGRYQNYFSADSMKKVAVSVGVKDAFICVYKGGTKMPETAMREFLRTAKANSRQGEPAPSPTVNTTSTPAQQEPVASVTTPTPEPVVKAVEPPASELSAADIIYKIQLGAFKENVPTAMVNSFLQLADQGITQEDDSRGFHIYYAGQYKSYQDALAGKSNAVDKGLKDAFIVPFANGKRITVAEAQRVLAK